MSKQITIVRPANADEVAAYKAAVAPLIGNAKAVIDLRCRMGIIFHSTGLRIKVRVAAPKEQQQ